MKWARTVVVMGLLALWMLASSHALLEEAGWIHEQEEHHHDASSNEHGHDAADGICRVASTCVHVPQPELDRGPLLTCARLAFAVATLFEASLALPNGPDPPGVAPPEFTHTWQFSFRASLPVRAPSLIS